MPGHGYAPLPGPQPGATKHLVKISEIRDLYTDEISVPRCTKSLCEISRQDLSAQSREKRDLAKRPLVETLYRDLV